MGPNSVVFTWHEKDHAQRSGEDGEPCLPSDDDAEKMVEDKSRIVLPYDPMADMPPEDDESFEKLPVARRPSSHVQSTLAKSVEVFLKLDKLTILASVVVVIAIGIAAYDKKSAGAHGPPIKAVIPETLDATFSATMSFLQKLSTKSFTALFANARRAPMTNVGASLRHFSEKGKAAARPFDDLELEEDEVEFTKPIEEDLPEDSAKPSNSATGQKGLQRDPVSEAYIAHRATMKRKFPDGWNPPKKLSRQLMDDMRSMKSVNPEKFTTDVLAAHFRVSPEAVRRILKSKWTPDAKRGEELQQRDDDKRAQTLEYYQKLRERRKVAREKNRQRNDVRGSSDAGVAWKQRRYGNSGNGGNSSRRFNSRVEEDGFAMTDRSDILTLTATGEGGLNELKDKLNDADCGFAYARVEFSNDKESKRVKFVLITWIGTEVKIMRRAK
ncbi:Required for respiratory growth protein 9 mitochondrial, partial [Tulasnella sp. 427]